MKTLRFLLLALLAPGALQAQILLFDSFDDGTVNPALWSVSLPFPQSRIDESGGRLTTTGRGTLATASGGFSGGLSISGTVTLNHYWENFQVCLRTDLTQFNEYWERMGVIVDFHNAYDVETQGVPGLAIGLHTPSGATTLASSSFTLTPDHPYSFTITDTGTAITLSIDGVDRVSAATTYAAGDRIAFFSREFADTSSSLDYVRIAVVPEPSTVAFAGLGILALAGRGVVARRK